ncbi:helix-turn-helix domain-containing protein [Clostridium sp. DL-VIII]|uniref:TetR/AcrR family transcriptional regulator n=1 Tax=Clostridium sp. DL-VIII TaxID=641107 RepID=UPI001FA7AE7F|nr:helix-turn-helix domain-containing protein [Clostridium sp. DL-VIII]
MDEIIDEADASRGTFYYYFNGKDDLLSSLSIFFDDKYEEVMQQIDLKINSFDKL